MSQYMYKVKFHHHLPIIKPSDGHGSTLKVLSPHHASSIRIGQLRTSSKVWKSTPAPLYTYTQSQKPLHFFYIRVAYSSQRVVADILTCFLLVIEKMNEKKIHGNMNDIIYIPVNVFSHLSGQVGRGGPTKAN